jgi:hypothetical protein
VTMYLRCLTGDRPRHWVQWLPWAEFCYNSSFQSSLRAIPFRVVYGCDPLTVPPYAPGSPRVSTVDQQLAACDEFVVEIHDCLEQAHQLYKAAYDKNHHDLTFMVGDWVWLRLLHRPIASLSTHGHGKLGPRFYGPFQIKEWVGDVAYKLNLPASARLCDIFHAGLLKPHKGVAPLALRTLPPTLHGRACPQPAKVIKGRLARGV